MEPAVRPPLINSRRLAIILLDAAGVAVALAAAFLLRFEFRLDAETAGILRSTVLIFVLAHLAGAILAGVHRSLYRYSGFSDLLALARGDALGGLLAAGTVLFLRQGQFPRSVLILHPLLVLLVLGGLRYVNRMRRTGRRPGETRTVLLVGAGELGEGVLRQFLRQPEAGRVVVGFVDDDPSKWGLAIHGVPVLGGRKDLPALLRKAPVDEIVVAISSRRGELVRGVADAIAGLPVKPELKVAPTLEEMLAAPGAGPLVRDVNPADLLNRAEIRLDEQRIAAALKGRTVLVTGAGGTIGGELCRQVLRYQPARLVVLEFHATSLFHIERELREKAGAIPVEAVLGDVRDAALLDRVFAAHRPQVVLHAAAHKHVHQLEHNVQEGVTGNILGTLRVAQASARHGADVCLLVSTDKAVKPSSVMGATKRVAELIMQAYARRGGPRYVGVRFGNVLGSSGSVLEIFKAQIARGGPVTVTDERATRYFMTVEEAVGLILQAAVIAQGGEVFVLKMGTPVRIIDLARNLVILHGLEPGRDIEIRITGLKQGEKLDEELIEDPADLAPSEHPDIMVLKPEPGAAEWTDALEGTFTELAARKDAADAVGRLVALVPSFTPAPALLPPAGKS